MSHSKLGVAFLDLHIINQPLAEQKKINREKWRFSWYGIDREAISRPTEAEAISRIFLQERGIKYE